ncbi:MAG: ATP-binding protein [Desulfobulbaceae bacterium]|nr:ATP-binding protein [Desulfobulbaceae bacterium]
MSNVSFEEADQLREFLFAVIESLPNGMLFADQDGLVVAINQKARKLLGLVGASVQNRSCWELLEQALRVKSVDLAGLQRSGANLLCEAAVSDKPDEKRYLAIARNELRSPFLKVGGFFLSVEDVTYLHLAEAQFDRQRRFDAMQEMAVCMSQELKNPLGSLELFASMLNRELSDDPDNQRITGRMINAIHTMDHLLNNYVTFASLPEPHWGRVDVRRWLDSAVEQVRQLDKADKVVFSCHYAHGREAIAGDEQLLRQLLFNLLLNSVESMDTGGEVTVSSRSLPAEDGNLPFLEIKVVDQGSGIAVQNLQRIFDPFFTTKDRASGLGLAAAHYIVGAHHGLIRQESREGEGAVFTVLIPERDPLLQKDMDR